VTTPFCVAFSHLATDVLSDAATLARVLRGGAAAAIERGRLVASSAFLRRINAACLALTRLAKAARCAFTRLAKAARFELLNE
jgi:hypothetical protein